MHRLKRFAEAGFIRRLDNRKCLTSKKSEEKQRFSSRKLLRTNNLFVPKTLQVISKNAKRILTQEIICIHIKHKKGTSSHFHVFRYILKMLNRKDTSVFLSWFYSIRFILLLCILRYCYLEAVEDMEYVGNHVSIFFLISFPGRHWKALLASRQSKNLLYIEEIEFNNFFSG